MPPSASAPSQTLLTPFDTKENLFSEHYLLNVLPKAPEWQQVRDLATRVQAVVKELVKRETTFEDLTELGLDREFFEPVFKALGHVSHVQVRTAAGKFPDYFFFENEAAKAEAERHLDDRRRFAQLSIAIGELKAWDRPLDGTSSKKERDELDPSIPNAQLMRYLLSNEKRWGILTNGRKWRIYHYEGGFPKVGRYYEVDVVALANARVEDFAYFAYFFRREAFIPDASGKTPLDLIRQGSIDYSKALAKSLEDSVYKALGVLANGFLRWRDNGLDGANDDHRRAIHENSLKLLYRLLFILKAESAGLLPLDNPNYRTSRSLDAIKRDIAEKKCAGTFIGNDSDDYSRKLNLLCNLIDVGSRDALRLSPSQPDPLGIPPYNGGLFRQVDPSNNAKEFLSTKRIGDADLAEAIDLLARSAGATEGEGFVDYTSLEAQQLGTLYEGLLEYQLGYASGEDFVAGGVGEQWIPESKHTGTKVTDLAKRAPMGTFYLQTDKGERHSTGSYYTPDFIVQEIVQKTLTPVLDRRLAKAREENKSLRDAVLHFRVLDPAMGSGHFLVGVVDYLTPKLIEAVEEDKFAGRLPKEMHYSTEDAKRDIVSHCVYGVDLNPMAVELAKVTLWLHTLARGKPLTFLDHRLKVGNSLLGANIRRLNRYPGPEQQEKWAGQVAAAREERAEQRFEDAAAFPPLFLEKIVGRIQKIDALRDEKIEDVKAKEKLYLELRASPEFRKIRAICDIWMSAWFGIESHGYTDLMWALSNPTGEEEWRRKSKKANIDTIRAFAKRKGFFHWEFEYPEVFFEGGALRDDSGFDAVVGNPPYLNIETLYSADPEAPPVFEKLYETAGEGRYDIYVMFVERGLEKLRPDGEFGYIMPNKWFKGEFGRPLRSLVVRHKNIREITDWRNYYTLFPGATTFVALLYLSRLKQENFRYVAFPSLTANDGADIAEKRLREAATLEDIRTKDVIVGQIPIARFSAKPWNFATGDAHDLLARLKSYPHFGTVAEVFEGVTTAATKVFYLRGAEEIQSRGVVRAWSDAIEDFVEIESALIRPLLNGQDVTRWRTLYDEDVILWHYDEVDGRGGEKTFALKSADELSTSYPLAWAYLNHEKVRPMLEGREPKVVTDTKTGEKRKVGKFVGKPDWYCYSYPRSMTKFSLAKLVLPDAASQGDAAWDHRGCVLANTLYGVVPSRSSSWKPFALQAILNNHLLTFWVREMGSPLKDGFYRFATKYVEPFPIPAVDWSVSEQSRHQRAAEASDHIEAAAEGKGAASLLRWVEERVSAGEFVAVHDALDGLGEKLNRAYHENFEETKAFLRWFQRTHMKPGARLDQFAGKTKLRQFSEYELPEILEVAKKNKKFLRVDPKTRAFQEEFEREFNASVAKQRPRFEAARRLEPLVEEIVYRMYGLTSEERAVVEEAAAAIQYK